MRPIVILRNEDTGDYVDMTRSTMCRLTQLEGTGEPDATVSSTKYAGADGSYIGAAYIEKRNIVMNFNFLLPWIERNRLRMYEIIQTRKSIRVYYKTHRVNVYTDGIVESFEVDNFKDDTTTGQISIICADPFWYSNATHTATATSSVDAFHFPFAIDETGVPFSSWSDNGKITITNSGISTGMTITMRFSSAVVNPFIHSDTTGQSITITRTFSEGEVMTITTQSMNKNASVTLSNGAVNSVIDSFSDSSTFLQLVHGDNEFSVGAESGGGYINTSISWQDTYLGV